MSRDVQDRLEESDPEQGRLKGVPNQWLNNRWLRPVPILLALGMSAICLALGVFCLVYLLFALVG